MTASKTDNPAQDHSGDYSGDSSGHLHYIPAGRPFAEDLVRGVIELTDGHEDVADSIILLPNRRLSKAVRGAFLRLSGGGAQLLPRMLSVGDVDEDSTELVVAGWDVDDLPQVIDPLERQLRLSTLVEAYIKAEGRVTEQIKQLSFGEMISLARALSEFLDQVETAGCDLSRLDNLAGGEHADHWSKILKFLKIITDQWPKILNTLNRSDPAVWRNAAIRARAKAWAAAPPKGLVVVAGSTGSVPAAQDLMKSVIGLKRGHIVLPGLDKGMLEEDWEELGEDDDTLVAHPQYPLYRLIKALGVGREMVALWPGTRDDDGAYDAEARGRMALLREVMRPARQTDQWRRIPEARNFTSQSLEGLSLAECYDRHQEAEVIALAMREVLETPGKTATLVTADLKLTEAVSDELKRWDIDIVPSAGIRLLDTPPAQFMRLILEAWIDNFSPVSLLAMARHKLATGGLEKRDFRRHIRKLEVKLLRGPYRNAGLEGLRADAEKTAPDLTGFIDSHLIAPLKPLLDLGREGETDLAHIADIHGRVAEAMSATPSDPLASWQGQDGHRLSQFLHKLSLYGAEVRLDALSYQSALLTLMAGETIYPDKADHPRLSILGTVEARMHSADLIILGGLNEGTMPAEPPADPWMSHGMRLDLGLPHAHWRIGLAAHDVVMIMAGENVLLTRAERDEGSPAAPSRWLQRLGAVMAVAEMEVPRRRDLIYLSGQLHRFEGTVRPAPRPNPKPPVDIRPRWFSATQLDTLLKDPYAIYARHILKLKALPELAEPPGAADRGTLMHQILYRFIREYPEGALPDDAEDRMMAIGREEFAKYEDNLNVMTFWWQRFGHLAKWFIEHEQDWRQDLARSYVEVEGEMIMPTAMGDITLAAKADRIDITRGGKVRIVDYKTGLPPTARSVEEGRSLQLRMEALLVGEGGYSEIDASGISGPEPVADLSYWHIPGKRGEAGRVVSVTPPQGGIVRSSREGIKALLEDFADPGKGYPSEPLEREASAFSDYKHLARIEEWVSTMNSGGDGGNEG
jgi:ATP-dependent helicase/nuclease subunit B